MFTDTDNQTLSFDTSTNILTIANGNTVDLSTLAGGGGASAMADLSDVDSNDTVTTGDMLLHDEVNINSSILKMKSMTY